jgi:hypothetical protein
VVIANAVRDGLRLDTTSMVNVSVLMTQLWRHQDAE